VSTKSGQDPAVGFAAVAAEPPAVRRREVRARRMSIFEKIAIFLVRLVGLGAILAGVQSITWYLMYLTGAWSKAEYGSAWGIGAGIYLIGGILLLVFSGRLGRFIGRGLQ